jgi:segregation and condensation protein B
MSDQSPDPDVTPPPQPADPPSPDALPGALEDAVRLVEALVFAASGPVSTRTVGQLLPVGIDPDTVVNALRARYVGRGVELAEIAGGLQFRTAPDLGPRLRRVVQVPRRLPRAAMETLAVIAYHQPVTRPEIEDIRGASLSQNTIDLLLEQGLVAPKGRKEAPGRPTLWATTPMFLAQFGLRDLRELPRREDLMVEPPSVLAAPDAAPNGPQEAPPDGTPDAAAGGASDSAPFPAPNTTPDGTSDADSNAAPDDAPDAESNTMPGGASDSMPNVAPDAESDAATGPTSTATPAEAPDTASVGASNSTPDAESDAATGPISNATAAEAPDAMPDSPSESTAEGTSGPTADSMLLDAPADSRARRRAPPAGSGDP